MRVRKKGKNGKFCSKQRLVEALQKTKTKSDTENMFSATVVSY